MYDAVIIGSGLGGLLTGALLAKEGKSVYIAEKLNFYGGRCTAFDYKGYQIPTGAIHMIPFSRGPMKQVILDRLNLDIEFIDGGRAYVIHEDGTPEELTGGYTAKLFMKANLGDKIAKQYMDAFYEFALGIRSNEFSFKEKLNYIRFIKKYGHPRTPEGGFGNLTKKLVKFIKDHGGEMHLSTRAIDIIIDGNRANGIVVQRLGKTEIIKAHNVISNAGPKLTAELLGNKKYLLGKEYLKKLENHRTVPGIKIAVGCSHNVNPGPVTLTPFLNRVSGFSEPTIADPSLAPKGKHLILSHQEIRSDDIAHEIELGVQDIKSYIKDFDDSCEIISVHSYLRDHPVNHSPQGNDFSQFTKVKYLYLVGDGAKPSGLLMTEGVAESAKIVSDYILEGH